jgi:hypothetical protein
MILDLERGVNDEMLDRDIKDLTDHMNSSTGTINNYKHGTPALQEYLSLNSHLLRAFERQGLNKVRRMYDYVNELVMTNEKINFPAAMVKLLEDYMMGTSSEKTTESTELAVSFVAQGSEESAKPIHLQE